MRLKDLGIPRQPSLSRGRFFSMFSEKEAITLPWWWLTGQLGHPQPPAGPPMKPALCLPSNCSATAQ